MYWLNHTGLCWNPPNWPSAVVHWCGLINTFELIQGLAHNSQQKQCDFHHISCQGAATAAAAAVTRPGPHPSSDWQSDQSLHRLSSHLFSAGAPRCSFKRYATAAWWRKSSSHTLNAARDSFLPPFFSRAARNCLPRCECPQRADATASGPAEGCLPPPPPPPGGHRGDLQCFWGGGGEGGESAWL